jgi:hypothetical protein
MSVSDHNSTLDLKDFFFNQGAMCLLCGTHRVLYTKHTQFGFIWFKQKRIANTNLFVTQVDSIAARGSCIFLRVLLRGS